MEAGVPSLEKGKQRCGSDGTRGLRPTSGFLVAPDLAQRDSAWPVAVGLLDTAGGGSVKAYGQAAAQLTYVALRA